MTRLYFLFLTTLIWGCAHAPPHAVEARPVQPLGEMIAEKIQQHYPKYVMDAESVVPVLDRLKKKSYLKYLEPEEQKLEIEESLEWFRDAHLNLRAAPISAKASSQESSTADAPATTPAHAPAIQQESLPSSTVRLIEVSQSTAVLKVPSFEAALKQFELVRACRLYKECFIDLSDNLGGYLDQMALFYVTLFNRDVPQTETFIGVQPNGELKYFTLDFLNQQLGQSVFSAQNDIAPFSLAIVIGPNCRSTCELFSSWVNQAHVAKLVGLPTGGGASSANPIAYELKGYPFILEIPQYLRLKAIDEGLYVTSQDSPVQPDIWLTRHQLSQVELMVQAADRHAAEIFLK